MIIAFTLQQAYLRAVEQAHLTGRRQRVRRQQILPASTHMWWTVQEVGQ